MRSIPLVINNDIRLPTSQHVSTNMNIPITTSTPISPAPNESLNRVSNNFQSPTSVTFNPS